MEENEGEERQKVFNGQKPQKAKVLNGDHIKETIQNVKQLQTSDNIIFLIIK